MKYLSFIVTFCFLLGCSDQDVSPEREIIVIVFGEAFIYDGSLSESEYLNGQFEESLLSRGTVEDFPINYEFELEVLTSDDTNLASWQFDFSNWPGAFGSQAFSTHDSLYIRIDEDKIQSIILQIDNLPSSCTDSTTVLRESKVFYPDQSDKFKQLTAQIMCIQSSDCNFCVSGSLNL